MAQEYEAPNELVFPVRAGYTADPEVNARFRRNFRAMEEWARTPHRTYGSRMISPLFYAEDISAHAFTAQNLGAAFTGVGTDLFLAFEAVISRRQIAFIWGVGEFNNTDAATAYRGAFFLPVDIGGSFQNGRRTSQFQNNGTPGTQALTNIRKSYIDVVEPTTIGFYWGWKQSDASPQDMEVVRQKMIVAMFDAPDMDPNGDVIWTPDAGTISAYQTNEGTDT